MFPQNILQMQNAALMARQPRLPLMQGGLGGLGGGLSDQVFDLDRLVPLLGNTLERFGLDSRHDRVLVVLRLVAERRRAITRQLLLALKILL